MSNSNSVQSIVHSSVDSDSPGDRRMQPGASSQRLAKNQLNVTESLPEITISSRLWQVPAEHPSLGSAEAHVWRASLEQPVRIVESLYRMLSPDERARANRFHFEKDRRHFIVARATLRKLLGQYLAIQPTKLQFTYGDYGKPQLAPAILDQPAKLNFNLAHADGLAAYAFIRIGEIGV